MNKVFLIGNLTKAPEISETASGVKVCSFSIAVNRPYMTDGERQTDFFNCTAWRGLAETIYKYTKKGNKVAVTGSIQIRNYEDNQGTKRTAIDIIVQDCEFLTQKTDEEAGVQANTQEQKRSGNKPNLTAMDDDQDIPF